MNQKYALIVDDEADLREVIAWVLQKLGFKTLEARDGSQAIALLKEQPSKPHLITTDIEMIPMDGNEFIAFLRADSEYKKIPIFVISSIPPNPILGGPMDSIEKPFTPKQLSLRLASFILK